METQFVDYYQDDWDCSKVISNYHDGDEDISVQDILKRARTFKISSKSFQLPTYERQIKGISFTTREMSSGHNFERNACYSDTNYPDMSDCLDSTLEGSNMMQPFCHQWLLQNGSSKIKQTLLDKDERTQTPKSCLNTHDAEKCKAVILETSKPIPVENSLDDYEKTIEKARQTAEKYSIPEDPITQSPVENSVTLLEKLEADDDHVQRSCESHIKTELKIALIENCKPEPTDNSLDDYEKTIARARQIAGKYCVTEDLITEAPKKMPLAFYEKLKLKADDAPVQRSCEKASDSTATNYLQKLKLKREKEILDSSAEICVKAVLNKVKRELHVEAVREYALKQRYMLETFDFNQNHEQKNVELQSNTCNSTNERDLKKPKVSLLSSAHGFQWVEETKISKRKSWRNRIAGLFCLRRCENI